MDSKEVGLVAVQQLTGVEDLHYGFWDEDVKPEILEFKNAQIRYTEFVLSAVKNEIEDPANAKILEVGCGTGAMLAQLLSSGYRIDGVIPSEHLEKKVNEKVEKTVSDYKPRIFGCTFEAILENHDVDKYDLIVFSESFQYVQIETNFSLLKTLLKEGGKVVICDFFKSVHHGDGGPGDSSFGGGHPIMTFYKLIEENNFMILQDKDITKNMSLNLELIEEILMERVLPTVQVLDKYTSLKYPTISKLVKFIYRKKLKKLKYKYIAGNRSRKTFERYKNYRLVVLGKS
ncbi:MAG: methyltransferase domain-containing protein [Desulfobacterales bacterium]|nr:methyltransferase domain-containing protein [Desulfobacterales bacterium]MCP4158553.1 methyltransferase domain-containing protein [Deltaproteobacteria bacterium]